MLSPEKEIANFEFLTIKYSIKNQESGQPFEKYCPVSKVHDVLLFSHDFLRIVSQAVQCVKSECQGVKECTQELDYGKYRTDRDCNFTFDFLNLKVLQSPVRRDLCLVLLQVTK